MLILFGLVARFAWLHPCAMKSQRDPLRKLRGASLLTDHAWLELARTLDIAKRELQIVQSVFDNLPEPAMAGEPCATRDGC